MNDKEKIEAAIQMLKKLKRMVGFFMKSEISILIDKLESRIPQNDNTTGYQSSKELSKTSFVSDSDLL
jgi:transcription initiation factor IIE alpha subunit